MKPTPEAVVARLRTYKNSPKVKFGLASEPKGERCYCIEGVFCSVAIDLGLPGAYFRPHSYGCGLTFICHQGQSVSAAPLEVFEFLGIPDALNSEQLERVNLTQEAQQPQVICSDGRVRWLGLNDCTDVELDRLIEAACTLVEN